MNTGQMHGTYLKRKRSIIQFIYTNIIHLVLHPQLCYVFCARNKDYYQRNTRFPIHHFIKTRDSDSISYEYLKYIC